MAATMSHQLFIRSRLAAFKDFVRFPANFFDLNFWCVQMIFDEHIFASLYFNVVVVNVTGEKAARRLGTKIGLDFLKRRHTSDVDVR